MRLFSMIKRNSRLALKGNWGRATVILLLMLGAGAVLSGLQQGAIMIFAPGPTAIPQPGPDAAPGELFGYLYSAVNTAEWLITGLYVLLTALLVTPVSLGAMRWFYNLVHGKRLPVADVFYFFEAGRRYGRAVWYEISITVRTLLWSLLFFAVPGCLMTYSVWRLAGEGLTRAQTATAGMGVLLASVLMLLASLFYSVCVMRYALAAFLLGEDDNLSARKAIKQSVRYTRGYRFSLMWFGLSYIWWVILAVIFFSAVAVMPYPGGVAPIMQVSAGVMLFALAVFAMLYYWPYYSAGLAMYARFIIEKKSAEAQTTLEFTAPEEAAPPKTPEPDPLENLLYDRAAEDAADSQAKPEPDEPQEEQEENNGVPAEDEPVVDIEESPSETSEDVPDDEKPQNSWDWPAVEKPDGNERDEN